MPIIAKDISSGGENFVPAPPGLHRAVCCDVVDRGKVDGKFGPKHLVRLVWQLESMMPDGKPYLIDRNYTLTLGERSALRRDLESWAGKPLTLEQAAGFDLEKLVGVTCTLVVTQKPSREGDMMFSNVTAVWPKQPGAPLTIRDYVRVIHRSRPGVVAAPVGPSFAPPPQSWPAVLPEPKPQPHEVTHAFDADPFGGQPQPPPITDSDIPFSWLLPLLLPIIGLGSLLS